MTDRACQRGTAGGGFAGSRQQREGRSRGWLVGAAGRWAFGSSEPGPRVVGAARSHRQLPASRLRDASPGPAVDVEESRFV